MLSRFRSESISPLTQPVVERADVSYLEHLNDTNGSLNKLSECLSINIVQVFASPKDGLSALSSNLD